MGEGAGTTSHGATRAEGLDRIRRYQPLMGRAYALGRNHDRGPLQPTTSQLSPFLRRRLVTEEEVLHAALAGHGPAAEKFMTEVLWRTYWKGWLEQRPSVWRSYLEARTSEAGRRSGDLEAALAGATGIDCFDYWTCELRRTGWLHNHARMWFASIWIFTLGLPWELGAEFFRTHLIDGDPASNTLSWRWVAGLHTRGKAYVARAENIARFTEGRFNPHGRLNEAPEPLQEAEVPAVVPLDPDEEIPEGDAALLLHEDDLCPETLPVRPARILAVGALAPEPGLCGAAAAWAREALHDGLARGRTLFDAPGAPVEDLLAWGASLPVRTLLVPTAPQGPARDLIEAAVPGLAAAGVRIVRIRRDWDRRLWPLAGRGFFAFREPALGAARQISAAVHRLEDHH